jgi:hypothetical protein
MQASDIIKPCQLRSTPRQIRRSVKTSNEARFAAPVADIVHSGRCVGQHEVDACEIQCPLMAPWSPTLIITETTCGSSTSLPSKSTNSSRIHCQNMQSSHIRGVTKKLSSKTCSAGPPLTKRAFKNSSIVASKPRKTDWYTSGLAPAASTKAAALRCPKPLTLCTCGTKTYILLLLHLPLRRARQH